jgi:hypothetical protein
MASKSISGEYSDSKATWFLQEERPHQQQVEPEVNADGSSTGTAQGRNRHQQQGIGPEVSENLEMQDRK